MANEKPSKILIVDDDEHMLALLALHVENVGFETLKAVNGKQALELLQGLAEPIAAIVSDVEMPEMDGYAFCETVRDQNDYAEIPFIFVSAKTSLEEKLKGYGVGGDEYISKPIDGGEVALKVQTIIEKSIKHGKLTQQLQESHQAAMQAMSYTSNLGLILQFMQNATSANYIKTLVQKFFETAQSLGLNTVVQVHAPTSVLNYKQDGDVSPLEANVIELARTKGRIFDFDARSIFNHDDFSILIKNMPLADKEKYGLMKDVLGNLCNAFESKLKLLFSTEAVKQKDDVLETVNQALSRIDQSYRNTQAANSATIDDMINRMEEAMFGFGLTEGQEDTVRGIIRDAKAKIAEVFEDGTALYVEFDKIHETLLKGLK